SLYWYGVLIEPIPFLFTQLKDNYYDERNRLIFLNIAISSDDDSCKILYTIDESRRREVPDWYFQLASFKKEGLFHHDIPNVDSYIKPISVPTLPIQRIINDHMEGRIDLLHIDAEGYDLEIVKTVDFTKSAPKIILVEYLHLDVAERKRLL
ncbi:MAG TPA: FkbM family methyltransferase, partial [Segetibacter sp.]